VFVELQLDLLQLLLQRLLLLHVAVLDLLFHLPSDRLHPLHLFPAELVEGLREFLHLSVEVLNFLLGVLQFLGLRGVGILEFLVLLGDDGQLLRVEVQLVMELPLLLLLQLALLVSLDFRL
jgi:hypothetical protein